MTEETAMRVAPMDAATAVKYGLFVQAAYDMYDRDPTNLNPKPTDSFPKDYVLGWTIQMTDFFLDWPQKLFYGVFAQSTTDPNEIVVALRGTRTAREWWDDFHPPLVPCGFCGGAGNVAQGFIDIYKTLEAMPASGKGASRPLRELLWSLSSVPSPPPALKLIVTGHSLGAALITLLALDWACAGEANPTVYTFASPRVGDLNFATKFDNRIGMSTSYRIWNWPDPVPRAPLEIEGYTHVSAAGYEINSTWYRFNPLDPLCTHPLNTYLYVLDQIDPNHRHHIKPTPDCQWRDDQVMGELPIGKNQTEC